MYTLFNTKSIWPVSAGPANQVFYSAVPGTPIMVNQPITNGVSLGPSSFYYQVQPRWLTTSANPAVPSRSRMSSDDVFLPEGAYVYEEPVYIMTGAAPPARQPQKSARPPEHRSRDSSKPRQRDASSSPDTSKDNGYTTPHKGGYFSENSSNASSHSNDSSPSSEPTDDSFLLTLFPASLAAALNEDPPEPKVRVPPKTSSPIHDETTNALHIDLGKIRKRRGRFITSSSSEKCKRFSENGVCEELDQCDKILLQSRADTAAEDQAKKREEFLLVLEAERERQKKLVLPRHTPKMMCKFCKNNGESPEVYTKHRLHYNEKTVCPILRHYVCRLCNSTGDFAHTIRHCPFNDRKDKIAWKATFIV